MIDDQAILLLYGYLKPNEISCMNTTLVLLISPTRVKYPTLKTWVELATQRQAIIK